MGLGTLPRLAVRRVVQCNEGPGITEQHLEISVAETSFNALMYGNSIPVADPRFDSLSFMDFVDDEKIQRMCLVRSNPIGRLPYIAHSAISPNIKEPRNTRNTPKEGHCNCVLSFRVFRLVRG